MTTTRTTVERYDEDSTPPRPPATGARATPPYGTAPTSGPRRLIRLLAPLGVLAVATIALIALERELRTYHLEDIRRSLNALRPASLVAALATTAGAYLALTCYDVLALRYVGRTLALRRILFASFIAYGFSQSISLSALTGASIRYRF